MSNTVPPAVDRDGSTNGRHRLPCVLGAGHDDDRRDALGNTWSADEQAAAQHSVDHAFPAVAAFLASGDARPDADLMRVDAPQVTEPRVHTIPLRDAPGATLTVTCPEWCTTDHYLDIQNGVLAADFAHLGAWADLDPSQDDRPLLSVRIEQWPFGSKHREPMVCTSPAGGQGGEEDLTPEDVRALADQLRAFAADLDELSVDLDDARRTAREGRGQGEGQ
ncbi:DUF6907 domain-containing protein [Streptomyces sp. NBC_00035]|uniref:DUF6907 domain-containing protein n=1 Tax=Streptomyces sp. NBC_00035 TaxID=2903614 RepID=UPI00324B76FF